MTETFDMNEDDEQAVADFMSRVSALPAPWRGVDPRQLWWNAELLRRWDAGRRAELPLDVVDVVEIAGAAVAAGLLLVWSLPAVTQLF